MSRKTTSRVAACGVAASLLLALGGTSAIAQTAPETETPAAPAAPAATAPDVTAAALSADKKSLVLTGERLTGATLVLVGDTPIKVDTKVAANVTATQVTVKAPAASLTRGQYFVAVVTPNGVDAIKDGYGVAPVIKSFTETTANATTKKFADVRGVSDLGGKEVRLTGTGFTGMTGVSFGTAAGTALTVVSDTEAKVTVPAIAGGYVAPKLTKNVDVKGTNTHGASVKAKAIAYNALPTVTAGNKSTSKSDDKAVKVTLTGTNLTGAGVKFGTKAGVVDKAASSATTLVVTVPVGVAGKVDVVVKTTVGEFKLPTQWTYLADKPATETPWPAAPVVVTPPAEEPAPTNP